MIQKHMNTLIYKQYTKPVKEVMYKGIKALITSDCKLNLTNVIPTFCVLLDCPQIFMLLLICFYLHVLCTVLPFGVIKKKKKKNNMNIHDNDKQLSK